MSKLVYAALLGTLVTGTAYANARTNYEAPRAQASTTVFAFKGVETFDSQAVGSNQEIVTYFGTQGQAIEIRGVYSGIDILAASAYGGAGGAGNFADANTGKSYTLTLSTSDGSELNYFGFWLSALDPGNKLTFYKNGVAEPVYTINPGDVIANTGACPASRYCSNPNTGAIPSEQYAFINVHFNEGQSYDRIVFSQWNQGNGHYESDNHTIGFYTEVGGVPEPSTWAMLIVGFGLVGATLRRRTAQAQTANA